MVKSKPCLPLTIYYSPFFHSVQTTLDLGGLRVGESARAEADAVVCSGYRDDFGHADRLGEFERRLVGVAAQTARVERRRHAAVELHDGPLRRARTRRATPPQT